MVLQVLGGGNGNITVIALDGTVDEGRNSDLGTGDVNMIVDDVAANVEFVASDDSDEDESEAVVVVHTPEMRAIDADEVRKVEEFFEEGCGCTLYNGRGCCYAFTREHISSIRDQCSSFERHDLQNILFGHVMATINPSEIVENRGHETKNRERIAANFLHEGRKVINYSKQPIIFV